ncbi:hypothetical protein C7T86_09820 [Xanthomonas citri pv. malvacearum]|uniref:Uncharacterized protein n=2 Tax=Xanthomonas TaxID=338 RepID=A0AA44Z1H1_XANCM|nr:hypothetical protein XppCFBP6164P_18500 [Xanthomonas phaseoli pv. phaseoli]MBO9743029.1 hypothetical protein [Xanthomonas phaseoli pv. phaseoli]NMI13749.1 hypothetical protein [Xanthomonas citri]PUE94032.1 hypothetical protein C7T86_09820 [Xanthomonas citri pv. malvacearum]QGL17344.1 hypothetical protein GH913_11465 [Xanthomonas citri pv. malvacearum]
MMTDDAPRLLTEAEQAALREEMRIAGRWMRARLGFASLIRQRLLGGRYGEHWLPRHREFADALNFLSLTLDSDAKVSVQFGVCWKRERHATGVFVGQWNGTSFANKPEACGYLHGQPCDLIDLWAAFDELAYVDLPEIRPLAWRDLN